jgi:hypothetical protein
MPNHDYSSQEALNVLMRKLRFRDQGLAAEVQAAIDAGKDVLETEPSNDRRRSARAYRKTVPFSHEEALQVALDALQAFFVEQPLFANSAAASFAAAPVGVPAPDILHKLLSKSFNPDFIARRHAVKEFERIGRAAMTPEVLLRLSEMLKDADDEVREIATRTLRHFHQVHGATAEAPTSFSVVEPHERFPLSTPAKQKESEQVLVEIQQQGEEKRIEIEIQTETQMIRGNVDTQLLKVFGRAEIEEQLQNTSHLRGLLNFTR